MQPLAKFNSPIDFVFCDIDDTLTEEGRLKSAPYDALWSLHAAGIKIIPITGRPAGWCELIARLWPVHGIIGENGGFYFSYQNKEMKRFYFQDEATRATNQSQLEKIKKQMLEEVPGAGIASDQFCRQLDLAVDFCEDVAPLPKASIQKIVDIFEAHGAQAKVSSIHVNGWFGDHDKLTMCKKYSELELGLNLDNPKDLNQCAFIGDSPNDEPMFSHFNNSFAVANIKEFADQLQHEPQYVTPSSFGQGFVEFAQALLSLHK